MKTFDEFMKEGGIFVEILSSILSGRSYATRRGNFRNSRLQPTEQDEIVNVYRHKMRDKNLVAIRV